MSVDRYWSCICTLGPVNKSDRQEGYSPTSTNHIGGNLSGRPKAYDVIDHFSMPKARACPQVVAISCMCSDCTRCVRGQRRVSVDTEVLIIATCLDDRCDGGRAQIL